MTSSDRLRSVAVVLALVSVLAGLGAAGTAAVVQAREEHDDTGWTTVRGVGTASYRVPGGADWDVQSASDPVSYRDADERPYVSGHAASFYFGNDCSSGGTRMAGAWAVLGDVERGTDAEAFAAESARRWARGYGEGRTSDARATEPEVEGTELLDGTEAAVATVWLDLSRFTEPCFEDAAELTVVAYEQDGEIRSLAVARYLGITGGLGDGDYAAIVASLAP